MHVAARKMKKVKTNFPAILKISF